MESPETPSSQAVDAGQDAPPIVVDVDTAVLLLGAVVAAVTHPLLYVKLLIQVGHEPLPSTVGTTMFGRRVLYLPGFFSYAHRGGGWKARALLRPVASHHVQRNLHCGQEQSETGGDSFQERGLAEFPQESGGRAGTGVAERSSSAPGEGGGDAADEHRALRLGWHLEGWSLLETSHEMIIQCLSRVATHPFHVMSVRCMAQFVGREVKYSGMFSCIVKIFKEEGLAGFYVGLIPHVVGEVLFLWCCNLLAHFINTYAVDESFSQASAIRSYTKFVMGIAVSVLTYPFMLVADLMAVSNCGLAAGLPPHSPVFKSWLHCWNHLSNKGHLFRGSSFFFRRMPVSSWTSIDD